MIQRYFILFMAMLLLAFQLPANAKPKHRSKQIEKHATSYQNSAEALVLADEIATRQSLDPVWVRAQIRGAKYLPVVVKLMQPGPASGKKNWQLYRSRFVTQSYIDAGVAFWQLNRDALAKAEVEFGIPPRLVVGILGIETIYGRNTGNFRVLDALTTLSFDYPLDHPKRVTRMAYFRNELEQFLVFSKRFNCDPATIKGSYAGAMGMPQFMPSSILQYAVDFDGNGKIDFWHSDADAIGSVANYFKAHGWKSQPAIGVLAPVELENGTEDSTMYFVDENFYVITQYNNSYYYAAAVIELGRAIEEAMKP